MEPVIDRLLLEKGWLIRRTACAFYRKHRYICLRYKVEPDELVQIARIAFWEEYRNLRTNTDFQKLIDRYATRRMKFRLLDYMTKQKLYALRNGNEPLSFDSLLHI